ncbi:GAF domain-containing protein [Nocardia miyunensis]|uniref:aspartate racemase/maleate isomerase family protein n=1 Tax=Nocardia miyunensis TaxID=282684 RepID=UPI00082E0AEC|nr:GAF domain-containing protein [Nocardia miyunensis]
MEKNGSGQLRIGMLTPSSNTCLEPMTAAILLEAEGPAAMYASRVPVTRIALDSQATAQFQVEPMLAAARLLADAQVDVIVWNGTAGSWLGVDHDLALVAAIEKETGIRATTSTLALLDACRAFGVTRLGLAVPYTTDVTDRIVARYAEHGVDCARTASLGLTENTDFATTPAQRVRQLIEQAGAGDVHAVAVVCTNVYGAPHVVDMENELGVPVFDSVAATLWQALRIGGRSDAITGWGQLLATGTLRMRFQDLLEDLLSGTGADRTTLRIDLSKLGLHVDLTAGEAVAPGVRSIRRDSSLDQRQLNTVQWLERHRRPLVQPHFRADPTPPDALITVYGVNAQMLAPIERGGELVAWLSVHSLSEREWGEADENVLAEAMRRVHEALDGI